VIRGNYLGDAVVVSGLLCSVSDVPAALAEFARVLRPGGQLRFYEHVRSRDALFARFRHSLTVIRDDPDAGWDAHQGANRG